MNIPDGMYCYHTIYYHDPSDSEMTHEVSCKEELNERAENVIE